MSLASHGDALDISFAASGNASRTWCFNHEFVLAPTLSVKLYGNLVEDWGSESVFSLTWTIRIESDHVKYSPSRHCAGVVVAGDAVRSILVYRGEQLLCLLLSAPLFALEIRE